jgi:hypothetical protein
MAERLFGNWVYGGVLAGLLLFGLAPVLAAPLGEATRLAYLALAAYMLHQYEEHDADRFRLFVNAALGPGRCGSSAADVFVINIAGVWGVIAIALWLAERAAPGWALIAAWLPFINAMVHIAQAARMRRYNPGLVTAIAAFIPLGLWMLIVIWPMASPVQHLVSLGLVLGLHAAIVARAARPV